MMDQVTFLNSTFKQNKYTLLKITQIISVEKSQ